MKKLLPGLLFACFVLNANLNAAAPTDSLNLFLHSPDLSERRAAYQHILNNRERYIRRVEQGLKNFARTKENSIDVLKRYIYLAAIIRSDRFLEPLARIFENYSALGGSCTYCCPVILALSLYGAFHNWSPPETMTESSDFMLTDLRSRIDSLNDRIEKPLLWHHWRVEFADPDKQKWFEGIESLCVQDLIRMTDPDNANEEERYWAAQALSGKVTDDQNLIDLYWLAIEALPHDTAGFYLCCTYEAIGRAEIARAKKREK